MLALGSTDRRIASSVESGLIAAPSCNPCTTVLHAGKTRRPWTTHEYERHRRVSTEPHAEAFEPPEAVSRPTFRPERCGPAVARERIHKRGRCSYRRHAE